MNYHNIYVPNDNDWANLKLSEEKIQNKVPNNIVFDLDNPIDKLESELLISEMRSFVLYYYLNSSSVLWKPSISDTIYYVSTQNRSDVFTLDKRNTTNPNQYEYLGNCYKTEVEAEGFKNGILAILNKWKSKGF